jgi:hypothetical protein
MRRYLVGLLAAAGLLVAGCATEDPAERPSTPEDPGDAVIGTDPVGLVGSWTLAELADGSSDSVIQLALPEVRVWHDCGILSGGWRANEYGQFVAYIAGYSGDCGGAAVTTPDWLSRATSYGVDGEARVLLDAQDQVVARLLPGATPTPGPDMVPELAEPPVVTDEVRSALAPAAPLPDDLAPADADTLTVRWVPADGSSSSTETPYVELAADGSWQGSDGCNGQVGRWVSGPDGALLAVAGGSTLIGCDNVPVGSWLSETSRAGFDGDVLVLLDAQGGELGRLQRA